MILEVNDVEKSFGGIKALDGISIGIEENAIIGLIGPNGSGKTTLLNTVSGFIAPDKGTVFFDGKDITSFPPYKVARLGMTRTFQLTRLFRGMTVLESMLLASKTQDDGLFSVFFNV